MGLLRERALVSGAMLLGAGPSRPSLLGDLEWPTKKNTFPCTPVLLTLVAPALCPERWTLVGSTGGSAYFTMNVAGFRYCFY